MTRAEAIANDPRVTVAARIVQFVTPMIVLAGLTIIGWVLAGQAAERAKLDSRITSIESQMGGMATRVTVLESSSVANKASRDKQINDINARIDQNQNGVEAKLDKITDSLTLISNQVAALNATLTATKGRL
jgi:hypothetical protein